MRVRWKEGKRTREIAPASVAQLSLVIERKFVSAHLHTYTLIEFRSSFMSPNYFHTMIHSWFLGSEYCLKNMQGVANCAMQLEMLEGK